MAKTELTKEMKEAIDSYGEKIKTLQTFVEMVRKRPGMYIGPIGDGGFLNMIREIFQNSVDQLVNQKSPCNFIRIFYDETNKYVCVEDNGMGIPFDDMERIFTKQHTSVNFDKKLFEYSSGLNGVGAKVTNALSSKFAVESYHYSGKAMRMELVDGKIKKSPFEIKSVPGKQGSKVEFIPEEKILGNLDLPYQTVQTLVKLILSLTNIGSGILFEAVGKDGTKVSEKMINEDGILTDLIMKTDSPIIKPITFSYDTGEMKADIAIVWASEKEKLQNNQGFTVPYSITTFSNWCPTRNEGSEHFNGFVDGIGTWFTNYMNKFYLSEKSKTKVVKNDAFEQLCAMVSVAHLEPQFIGQSKDILSNKDMKPFVKQCVIDGLDNWAKENPQDLQKVCKWIKEVAAARMRSEDYKINVKVKDASKLTGLPKGYEPPTGKEELELVIVEGDSAGGQAKDARDPRKQGIYPIRGKIINPFGNSMAKVMANEEIKGLINIIGAGYGKNFDIKKVKFKKIIFLADADVDGDHISALLLRVFIILFPGLIEAGLVFKGLPPLFGLRKGKKTEYFIERDAYNKYKETIFLNTNNITGIKGEKISTKEMNDLIMTNEDYCYEINRISSNYTLDPVLLEMAVYYYTKYKVINCKQLINAIKKRFRFAEISYDKKSNTLIIGGLINDKINQLYLNARFIEDCSKITPYMEISQRNSFIVNGTENTLYELLSSFETAGDSKDLTRYKGLGEMESEDLEDCLRPDGHRNLIQYTTKDINEDVETIRMYESDKNKILKMIGVVKRADLLG